MSGSVHNSMFFFSRLEMLYLGLTQRLRGLQALLLFWLEILLLHWTGLGILCFLGLML